MKNLRDQLQSTLGDGYSLERELGGGGMSRVFLAHDVTLKRRVVVKVLSPELAAGVSADRFRREIELTARLQHPHIVSVLSTGMTGGLPYYTLPFEEGESLSLRLKTGPLAVPEALSILRNVASSLAYAHANGVVHRDIKPDNVLISAGYAVVTDFGIAKAIVKARNDDSETLTATGIVLGTPAYMAPEQLMADDRADHRVDIYSLGLLGCELLTGRIPRDRTVSLPPAVPAPLADLLRRCIELNPNDRYQRAEEVVQAIDDIISGSGQATRALTRPSRWKLVAAAVLVLAAVAVAAARLIRAPVADPSVVVLPFEGADTVSAYFAEGVAEEITVTLQNTPGLRVAPRTSAVSLSRRGIAADSIARLLGVRTVLAGTVRRDGDRLRISTELTDIAKGKVLWSERFERERKDIFRVQDDIANAIATALRVRLGPAAQRNTASRTTTDPEAYDLYLRGRYFWSERTETALARAVEYFQRAIDRDPTFAAAISGLADAHAMSAWYSYVSPSEGYSRSKELALRALALDSTRAEPHASLGHVAMYYDWDFAVAEREMRRAIAIDSTYATAHQWYGMYLAAMGRFDESIAQFRRAWMLDPLNRIVTASLCWAQGIARQYQEAVAQCRRAVDVDSTFAIAHLFLGRPLIALGDTAGGLRALRRAVALSGGSAVSLAALALAYASLGRRDEAMPLLNRLRSIQPYVPAGEIAHVYGALGERDEAFRWFERAFAERSPAMVLLQVDPMLDPLRSDPRFIQLVRRVGLPPLPAR